MAADSRTIIAPTDAELLQAQADLWRHSLYYLTSMALKCAVELHIPTAIHNLGGAASLPDLVTALSLPQTKLPFLRRLMRLLITSGIFASESGAEVETYRLNPLSWLLVEGVEAEDHTYQKYFALATVSLHYLEAGLSLADWFKKDLPVPTPSPFEELHGVPLVHETTKLLDEELDRILNEGVADMTTWQLEPLFGSAGVRSLTDCGGGDGTTVRGIIKAFPDIKCTVLDLPRVIENAPAHDSVNYVAGDMFHSIPPAQTVLVKLLLHFFNDEDCVKILEQCRKAIPSKEEGGKVIIIEIAVDPSVGPIMYEAQLLMDMLMMMNIRGRQRDENDWREIFMKAGFSDYKIVKKIGARGVIEVYP
ncbi:putative O-methyltransferase 2 [Panicum miliaceum]|uniref:O-methyltransferase 2 n=1 Tax=Panicum miliaceum TaxID=4540 RepID=A0A3L6PJX4_PANMI|nr:putative O-methyltransferase 2 [Panicum miliaceum]